MSCERFEIEIISLEPSREAQAHLDTCTNCQALQRDTAQFLKQLALPSVSAVDQQRLEQLPKAALVEFSREQRRRSSLRHFLGYALAAGIGALVSAAAFTHFSKNNSIVGPAAGQLTVATSETSIHLSEDEVFPEVSWPSDSEFSDTADNAETYGDLQ